VEIAGTNTKLTTPEKTIRKLQNVSRLKRQNSEKTIKQIEAKIPATKKIQPRIKKIKKYRFPKANIISPVSPADRIAIR
jgi:cell fate (sporulation/competence/biofilm development) regulator YmcA (YheA/YmcA/DUF963 family)